MIKYTEPMFLEKAPTLTLKAPPLEDKGGASAPPSMKKRAEAWLLGMLTCSYVMSMGHFLL